MGQMRSPAVAKSIFPRRKDSAIGERARLSAGIKMPLHWPATADEIAQPATWFASEACSFVTGQVLFVDGGFEAQRVGGSLDEALYP